MATAVLLTDAEHAPRYSYRYGGLVSVVQTWRVDTEDEQEAMTAPELPRFGDSLGTGDSSLLVKEHSPRFEGGTYCLVEVVYESPAARQSQSRPEPAPNVAYTERTKSVQTVPVKFAADPDGWTSETNHALDLPIRGGEGAAKEVTGTEYAVVIYRDPAVYNPASDLALQNLEGTTNASTLSLPPIHGTRFRISAAPRTLRYQFTEIGFESGLVKLTHHFVSRADHLERWQAEDDKGMAVGGVLQTEIYAPAAFPQSALD